MVEENDKSINTGNEYKDKIRELEAKITNIVNMDSEIYIVYIIRG